MRGTESGDDSTSFEVPSSLGRLTAELLRVGEPQARRLQVRAALERSVNSKRQEALAALAIGEVPSGIDPDVVEPFSSDGRPSVSVLSPSVKELFLESLMEVSRAEHLVAYSLRWRRGVRVPMRGFNYVSSEFSLDGHTWVPAPTVGIRMRVGAVSIGTPLDDRLGGYLGALLAVEDNVPIGHELLFEAQDLAWQNERAALILSLAALEVGCKELIGSLVPDATWLVENIQSPPLERILGDYLSMLPVRGTLREGGVPQISPALIAEIKKAVKLRNDLVHLGKAAIDDAWLDQWLTRAESLLYAFDAYAGRAWAADMLDDEEAHLIEAERSSPA